MPLYEYKCNACGKESEELSTKYEPVQEYLCCEQGCGGKLKLQISLPAETDSTLGYPYYSENMGHEIVRVEGRGHRDRLLRERKLGDVGPAMRFGGIG